MLAAAKVMLAAAKVMLAAAKVMLAVCIGPGVTACAICSVLPSFSKGQGAILEKGHVERGEQWLKRHLRHATK